MGKPCLHPHIPGLWSHFRAIQLVSSTWPSVDYIWIFLCRRFGALTLCRTAAASHLLNPEDENSLHKLLCKSCVRKTVCTDACMFQPQESAPHKGLCGPSLGELDILTDVNKGRRTRDGLLRERRHDNCTQARNMGPLALVSTRFSAHALWTLLWQWEARFSPL